MLMPQKRPFANSFPIRHNGIFAFTGRIITQVSRSYRFPEAAQTLKLTLPPPLENIYIFCKEGVVMNKKDNVKQTLTQ